MGRHDASGMSELRTADRRRLRRVVRELDNSWPDAALLPQAARLIGSAFGSGHATCLYQRSRCGGMGPVGHNFGGAANTWKSIQGHEKVPTHYRYSVAERDRLANQPVDEQQLYRGAPAELERYRGEVIAQNGLWHQLRTVVFDRGTFAGFFGILRAKGDGAFSAREHALMRGLLPHVRSWLSTSLLLHQALGDTAVAAVVDTLEEPAFLTTLAGVIVHANPAARRRYTAPPDWLRAIARRGAGQSEMATTHRIESEGVELLFIRLRTPEPGVRLDPLPDYLKPVAELMAGGASDKEIAVGLDIRVATARTYAGRVLERLGLHDRRELIRRM